MATACLSARFLPNLAAVFENVLPVCNSRMFEDTVFRLASFSVAWFFPLMDNHRMNGESFIVLAILIALAVFIPAPWGIGLALLAGIGALCG